MGRNLLTIFRVEHQETGAGPFRLEFAEINRPNLTIGITSKSHPSPIGCSITSNAIERLCARMKKRKNVHINNFWTLLEDELGDPYFDGRVGLSTIEQVFHWFSKEDRLELNKCGFALSTYEIPKNLVAVGKHQVYFLRRWARCITTSSLLSI